MNGIFYKIFLTLKTDFFDEANPGKEAENIIFILFFA